jgi:cytidylate kinase
MSEKKIVIAIDGYSSCGKSTLAKSLARKLGYAFIDSGAMYRAVTLYALRHQMIENGKPDEETIINSLEHINITFQYDQSTDKNTTFLNGENVEEEIRKLEVSENVSPVSAIGEVRREMVRQQQRMGQQKGIVMDGRDIGTVVFPEAELKIFMTASPEIRAQRRFLELSLKGESVSLEEIKKNLASRDYIDQNRAESPLRQAIDALVLDNSHLTPDEQLEWAYRKAIELIVGIDH